MSRGVPDYSPMAADYARVRPAYPAELFAWLASEVSPRRLALDCATGSGQAAVGLAEHFERVVAIDASEGQLAHAAAHPRVEYRLAKAEESGLETGSVDLVTAAAAAHWFDPEGFAAEVRRVVRPRGLLAVWTYHIAYLEPPFDEVLRRFYDDFLAPWFGDGARLVDRRYEDLELAGEPLAAPSFHVEARWTLDDVRRFVGTWSGTQTYKEETGEDPFERLRPELEAIWGDPEARRPLRWPLFVEARRL